MNNAALALITAWVILGNGAWYACKVILKRNGYPVSWFFFHFQDFPNMRKLIAAEQDPSRRNRQRALLYTLYTSCALLPFVFFALFKLGPLLP